MDTPIQTSGLANVINLSAFRSSPLARESTDTHDTPIEKSEEGVHHTKGAVISESFVCFPFSFLFSFLSDCVSPFCLFSRFCFKLGFTLI